MRGDELAWFELADRLGMSVTRCKFETSSSEFLMWREFIKMKLTQTTPEHYYLAQIAAEVRRSFVKSPVGVKLADFLFKLKTEGSAVEQPLTLEEKKQKAANSKSIWKGWAESLSKFKKTPSEQLKLKKAKQ